MVEHYFFKTVTEFEHDIANRGFLEYAQVFGKHYYGTPRSFIADRHRAGLSVIMDIDVQGAQQLRDGWPDAVHVFIAPPSLALLEQRLRGRGTEDEATIQKRLDTAVAEIAQWHHYDYCLINDDLSTCQQQLAAIAATEARRCSRLQPTSPTQAPDGSNSIVQRTKLLGPALASVPGLAPFCTHEHP